MGIDEFQTRLWKAWEHKIALNFMVSSFHLKKNLPALMSFPYSQQEI
jgi:hypothetical protein